MTNQSMPIKVEKSNLPPTDNERGIENHKKAAKHHEEAARHHHEAVKNLEKGNQERDV